MIYTEAFFADIKTELIRELKQAKSSIFVAVAWFTDTDLFDLLLEKAKSISVQLIVFEDEINSTGNVDFNNLNTLPNGKVAFVKERLMHHKFCVIDDETVITGSYNWTFKAHLSNDENIVVVKGDSALANSYIKTFHNILQPKKTTDDVQPAKVIKRLKLLINLIELEEIDDIALQVSRLESEDTTHISGKTIPYLKQKEYSKAVIEIETCLSQYSQLAMYVDVELEALKWEIKSLEYQVIAIDNEIADQERIIFDFNHRFHLHLGGLMSELYKIKIAYNEQLKQKSKPIDEDIEELKNQYEDFTKTAEEESKIEIDELDENAQKTIKETFKKAVMLCHPDKFQHDESLAKKAGEIFIELKAAYDRQDIKSVTHIFEKLEKGILQTNPIKQNNKALLKLQLDDLKQKYLAKTQQCLGYKKAEVFTILKEYKSVSDFLQAKAQELKMEIETLNLKMATL